MTRVGDVVRVQRGGCIERRAEEFFAGKLAGMREKSDATYYVQRLLPRGTPGVLTEVRRGRCTPPTLSDTTDEEWALIAENALRGRL